MIEDIIKISYITLNKVKSGNFKSVKEELDILSIDYSDNDLLIAYHLSKKSNSIEDALNLLANSSEDLAKEAEKKINEEKLNAVIEKKDKAEEKRREELEKNKIKDQAKAFNYLKNINGYVVCGGKSPSELERDVIKKMNLGYVPYGGVSTYNPGGKLGGVPDSFFQAMVRFK